MSESLTTLEGMDPVWSGSVKAGFAIFSETERRLVPTEDIIRRIRSLQEREKWLIAAAAHSLEGTKGFERIHKLAYDCVPDPTESPT